MPINRFMKKDIPIKGIKLINNQAEDNYNMGE